MNTGAKEPRSGRISGLGALLSIVIAAVLGLLAWHVVLHSELAGSADSATSAGGTPASAPCSFTASSWTDQSGHTRLIAELKEIESEHQRGKKADFHARDPHESAADLSCTDLHGFRLAGADMRGTRLVGAILSGADLSGADLRLANLTGADLSGSKLDGANLDGDSPSVATDLSRAHMKKASFIGARLKYALFLDHADLRGAQLGGAELPGTDFTGADLAGADVTQAQFDDTTDLQDAEVGSLVFEPMVLPDAEHIYEAHGLPLLTYARGDRKALAALRKRFHNDGYEEQERQIIYALQHTDASLEWKQCLSGQDASQSPRQLPFSALVSNCVGASLNKLVFDLPFQYGMNPSRPLYIIGALWLLCGIVYAVIIKAGKRSAIFLVCRREYLDKTIVHRRRIVPRPLNATKGFGRLRRIVQRESAVWRVALFFSLLSALNIGFQELQLGRWLKLLTTREYDLKAGGWARTLSGVQSLLSLLMLALSIWALFGQPFSS